VLVPALEERDREIAGLQTGLSRQSQVQELASESLVRNIARSRSKCQGGTLLRKQRPNLHNRKLMREFECVCWHWKNKCRMASGRLGLCVANSCGNCGVRIVRKSASSGSRVAEDLRTALREVRELAENTKIIALSSQTVSEEGEKVELLPERIVGRVARLDAEFAALCSSTETATSPVLI
jgi:hypothetical protein